MTDAARSWGKSVQSVGTGWHPSCSVPGRHRVSIQPIRYTETVMNIRHTLNRLQKVGLALAGLTFLFGALATPASAQVYRVTRSDAKNAVGFNLGYFAVKGASDR